MKSVAAHVIYQIQTEPLEHGVSHRGSDATLDNVTR